MNTRNASSGTTPSNTSPVLGKALGKSGVAQQKANLRQTMRGRRRELDHRQQAGAALAVGRHVLHSALFRRAHNIGLYLENDGEIGTRHLIQACARAQKSVWLPEVTDDRELRFLLYHQGDKLVSNHYGILQPRSDRPCIDAMDLDLVALPLVAFDRCGMRLGMGGGFYDRAFGQLSQRHRRPWLLGLAHGCQEIENVPTETWDRCLHAVATESGLRRLPS
jgi:5-formyltetrahydrofolate cyclo-ligase